MSYTLWSHGRLLGRTELDLPHFFESMRLGFVEPTADGERALADASGVPSALLALRRTIRRAGEGAPETRTAHADAREAFDRREAVCLELRDASGRTIPAESIDVHDLHDEPPTEEDLAAHRSADDRFEVFGGDAFSPREPELTDVAEPTEAIELLAPPCSPPDERWATMRYIMTISLLSPTDLP